MSIRKGGIVIAGSGGTGGGITNVDNETIITKADGSISTIAVTDQNNTETVKFWTGTLAEYEALTEHDDNTLYNITDDDESVEGLYQDIEELMAKFKPATTQEIGLVKPDGTTITITPQAISTDGQKATITVKSAAKGSYGEQTATYEATVNRGQITLEAKFR